jgi:hypothetical protein
VIFFPSLPKPASSRQSGVAPSRNNPPKILLNLVDWQRLYSHDDGHTETQQ